MELSAGDVVVLKSGGMPMTIGKIEGTKAFCIWTLRGKVNQQYFELLLLKKFVRARPIRFQL